MVDKYTQPSTNTPTDASNEPSTTIRLTSRNRRPQFIGSAPLSVLQKSTFFAARLSFDSEFPIDLEEEEGLVSRTSMLSMLHFLKTGRVAYNKQILRTEPRNLFSHVENVQKEIVGTQEFANLAVFLGVDIEGVADEMAGYIQELLEKVEN